MRSICRKNIGGVWGWGVGSAPRISDGVGHGDVDVFFWVVPIDGQFEVLDARWVNGNGVMLFKCINELGGVGGGK